MPEPIIEKNADGQDPAVRMFSEELRRLREESSQREKRLVADLEARHALEQEAWRKERVESEKRLMSDLEVRHTQEVLTLQAEGAERERKLLSGAQAAQKERARVLIAALVKARLERDRIILAVSFIVSGALLVLAFTGRVHGVLPVIILFVAIAGLIGAAFFARKSLECDEEYLEHARDAADHPDPFVVENDGIQSRLLTVGLVSAIILGLIVAVNFFWKHEAGPKVTALSSSAPTTAQAEIPKSDPALPATSSAPSVPLVASVQAEKVSGTVDTNPAQVLSTTAPGSVKTTGNGGNFGGGYSRK